MGIEIKGSTRFVCLLGNPVAHSLSPQIHNLAFSKLGLPFVYIPLAVGAHGLPSVIQTIRECSFLGANVTLPHKRAVLYYCDKISNLSRLTGTVNTLYFKDGELHGTTTDPEGFFRALASMGCDIVNQHIVILGNGGAARTLAVAIADSKSAASLTIAGRNELKVKTLCEEISVITGTTVEDAVFQNTSLKTALNRCTLLVNCTSAGMHPHEEEIPINASLLHANMTVFDTIYNPKKTRLILEAESRGCVVQNGMRMLLYQALASFKYWTNIDVPEHIYDLDTMFS